MSYLTSSNKVAFLLSLVPVFWMGTGMLWDGDGDMRLVPIVLVISAVYIFLYRLEVIKDNFKTSFWVKLLIVNGLFGLLAYELYGFDSRELRATLIMLVLFLVTPKEFYTKKRMQYFFLIAAISCFLYGYYYQVSIHLERGLWPINAIPFATICGLISISSLGLLFTSFKGKNFIVLTMAMVLAFVGLLLSQSRGPLIAIIVVTSAILLYISAKRSKVITVAVTLCLVAAIGGITQVSVVQERIKRTIYEYHQIQSGYLGSSIGVRFQMATIGFELWQKKPILGFGKEVKSEFNRLESEKVITPSVNRLISMTFHNGYLDKFVLYGVFGGVIFLIFMIYPMWVSRLYPIRRGAVLLWAPALFIAICNLSDAPFINAQAAIYYMFIIGSVTIMLSNEKEVE